MTAADAVDEHGVATTPDGARLRWRRRGAGEPMLLISGQAVGSASWDPIVPALARHHEVITFDLRGIDGSGIGEAPAWTMAEFADDALAVLHAAGVERAHVVGHSMGGRVSQRLAIEHPDVVATLTLIATTGGDAGGVPRDPEASRVLASGGIAELAPYFFGPGGDDAEMARFLRRDASITARRGHYTASLGHDAWGELGAIAAPTLVIHDTADEITPAGNGRMLAAAIPRAELLEIADGHHAVHLQSAEVVPAVPAFAAAHPAAV